MQESMPRTGFDVYFDELTHLNVWRRLFRWKEFIDRSIRAYRDVLLILADLQRTREELQSSTTARTLADNNLTHERGECERLQSELSAVTSRSVLLADELADARKHLAMLEQQDGQRQARYDVHIAALHAIRDGIKSDRADEMERSRLEQESHDDEMRRSWINHQDAVRDRLRLLAQKHTVEYVDTVPFPGSPDNTLLICNEYIIFDAKSPAIAVDISNFRNYIRTQAEAARKYAIQNGVRREIYFVIPTNTVELFDSFCMDLADYKVFLVSLDMLEPLILSLKRLETYEFAEQLSPEDREDICRVIGRFTHLTKRRLQVDQFFGARSLELLGRAQADLPVEIHEKVQAFGRSDKINPPIEQRNKEIDMKELFERQEKIGKDAERIGIQVPQTPAKEELPGS
jgi:hypothetical protein